MNPTNDRNQNPGQQEQNQEQQNQGQEQQQSVDRSQLQDKASSPLGGDSRNQQQPGSQQNKEQDKPAETETGTEKENVDPQQNPEKKY
jgi:hypothetical protein